MTCSFFIICLCLCFFTFSLCKLFCACHLFSYNNSSGIHHCPGSTSLAVSGTIQSDAGPLSVISCSTHILVRHSIRALKMHHYVHHLPWCLLLALQTGFHLSQAGLIPFPTGIHVGFHPFMMGIQLGYCFFLNGLCPGFVYIYPGDEST